MIIYTHIRDANIKVGTVRTKSKLSCENITHNTKKPGTII